MNHHGYIGDKEKYLTSLKRLEGQTRGLQRMVDQEVYCIDILTQIASLTGGLQNLALGLLEDHLNHCVASAVRAGGDEAEAKLSEALAVIARLVKA